MTDSSHGSARDPTASAGVRADTVPTVISIQYLRALAACLIVFHHAMAPAAVAPYYPHHFGQFGVDLFFVISGYIMWTTTAGGQSGVLSFWIARIIRIVPLYWVFTSLFIAIALLTPWALFNRPELDPLLIFKSYLFVPDARPPAYSLGWTLNYEMLFYFIFGLCLLVPQRLRAPAIAAALFAVVLAGGIYSPTNPMLMHYTNPIMLEFLAGVMIAAAGAWLARLPPIAGLGFLCAGVLAVAHYAWAGPSAERYLVLGIPAALIVMGSLAFEPKARLAPNRLGLLLGDASYSIYLAHPFAQRLCLFAAGGLLTVGSTATLALFVLGAIACGIAGGVVSYMLLERPLLAVGRKLTGRRPARSAAYA